MGWRVAIGAALLLAMPAGAEVRVWSVGQGGDRDWDDEGLVEAAVEFLGGAVQPKGLVDSENIVSTLDWIDVGGTPGDLVSEGQARVWSNVAGKTGGQDLVMVDGDAATSTGAAYKANGVRQTGRTFTFDLGASFPASRVVIYPSPQGEGDFLRGYEIKVNSGRDFDREGRPNYVLLRRDDLNREPRIDLVFPQQLLRFIELKVVSPNPFEIAEVEVYGNGFVPQARYESAFLQFPEGLVNLGRLRVTAQRLTSADAEPVARAVLQVRNGTDESPQVYFFVDPETQNETEITQSEYNRLEEQRRTVRYDAENWSAWSEPVIMADDGTFELDLSPLPGPRPFFQFAIAFTGTSDEVVRVTDLEFTYSSPLAATGVAEVALLDDPVPAAGVTSTPTGEPRSFLYGVGSRVGTGDTGFDGVRIQTTGRPRFLSLALNDPANTVEPDSFAVDDGGLSVYFPSQRVAPGDSVSVWIGFETSPLFYSTLFRGWLLDTGGEVPQPLQPGDVGEQIGTGSLIVFGSLGNALARFDLAGPGVVTPNGDGRNDTLQLEFDLVFLVAGAEVDLTVYDLAGRPLRRLVAERRAAGRYAEPWDGRDDARDLVPPGSYLCRLEVKTQDRSFTRFQVVGVAY